ncbi:translocation/assembly module TamB [Sediminibacterium roseum]|uniref:Translocation/assembly module TamB n=1 Tax=Sediminibacterium roseum TaxID=1978412 RepID=A0ABW9ZU45_9BACT|nr:translocation/assembly module TamB domain-containing protein [Sediminibacterium roseum]NCI50529.1 translocation/assembly module TamB [Sediminibacterium roseum]
MKNFFRGKLEAYLVKKTQSEIHIGAINYRLPKWVELDGVFFRDKKGDTLLYGSKLRVDVNMLKLLKGQYEVSRIELGGITVNIKRAANDSIFNYQYLVDAFASKEANPAPKKESTFSIRLDQLDITKSAIRWDDKYGGTILTTRIGDLKANVDSLDIFKQKYALSKFTVADMFFDLQLLTTGRSSEAIAVSDSAKESILPSIMIGKMNIARSHFAFYGQASGLRTVNDINEFNLNGLAVAAPQKISLDKAELNNSSLLLDRNIIEKAVEKIKQIDTVTSSLAVVVKELRLSNNNIAYNNPSAKKMERGFDANHVNLLRFNAGLTNMGYGDNTIRIHVDSLSFKEKSGLVLDSLHGDFSMDDSTILAKNMLLKTPFSRISGEALVFPASIDGQYRGNQQNRLVMANNVIARKDIQLLAPSIMDKYNRQLQGVSFIYVTADVTGNPKKAVIKTLALHSDKNDLILNTAGTVSNAMSKDALMYDLSIARLTATKSFLEPFVNTKGKKLVNLPPVMNITGKLRGDMRQLTSDLLVTSAYGQASVKGQLRNFTNPDKLGYNMRLIAKDLETGKWINKDSMLGKLNGNIYVKGSGIDYKTASVESKIDINSFRFQQHLYTGINFNINGTSGAYDVKGKISDSLIRMNMDVKTALNQQYPSATGKVNVDNADLFALGFYKEPFRFRSMIDLQAKDLSPQTLNAMVRLDSTIVYQEKRTIRVDSIIAKGSIDSGQTLLTLWAPFADAAVKGDYRYNELPGILQNYMARYSKTPAVTAPVQGNANFTMNANLKPDPIYAMLLPGLFFDKNIHATAKLDTKQKDSSLVFYLAAPVVVYENNRVSNLNIRATGVNDSIKYAIVLDTARASSIQLFSTAVTGGLGKGNLTANIVTNDARKKERYALSITAMQQNNDYRIRLGNRLKLNYADWNVDNNNMITYGKGGVNISQFNIRKGTESISINSASTALNAPIDLKVDRFSLQNVMGLMDRDSLEIAGMLNVQVRVDGLDKTVPLFNGNVKVDSLAYQGIPVGNLVVNAASDNNQAVTFDGKLTGNNNNVDIKGNYNQDKIDATVLLQPMELKTIEPFTQKNLTRSTGKVSGNVTISGNVKSPEWNGNLTFDSASTTLAEYGTVLKIDNQQIVFKYPDVTLNNFTVRDSLNHPLTVNGKVTQGKSGFVTDLSVKTRNFTALDNTPVANNQIYGKAIVDVDVTINGPVTAPDITGNVALKEKSAVTFVRQPKIASAKDREGVMEFVDIDTVKNFVFRPSDTTTVSRSRQEMASLNYNLNIDISKDAKFSIVIDPLTRDELQVQGAGQLNAAVNPNGDISLTGAYNLTKGSYQLNYKFLKRRFELQEGSTIVLSGDPANAEANITAVYEIEASPFDLLSNEVSDNSNPAIYRQKIPFEVVLKIKGRAMEPELTFDVQLKEGTKGINSDMSTTIDNKLTQMRSDPSTMNKQVFALLVMGRFIGEQSKDFFGTSSSDGLKADQVVKQSVGRFLADAVSQVAADLIKGVEVDVDLKTVDNYTDATQRTDLNLALSKRFLNDRLSLTVGKNFTVEGEDPLAKGQDNSNISFLPDITTTYKLSKDGRYMVKAYQKSDYEAILDGYFIETGVAFTLSMDYDKFKELFRKSRDRNAKANRKAEKERAKQKEIEERKKAEETNPKDAAKKENEK